MDPAALSALSPVDGRYRKAADGLRSVLSESGLIRERIRIEAAWLLSLAESVPQILRQPLPDAVRKLAAGLAPEPGDEAPAAVKTIESRINHDVKAVEYFVREKLNQSGATRRSSSWSTSAAPPRTSTTWPMRACCAPRARCCLPSSTRS